MVTTDVDGVTAVFVLTDAVRELETVTRRRLNVLYGRMIEPNVMQRALEGLAREKMVELRDGSVRWKGGR